MPHAPKMQAARYPWLLKLTREVCEAIARPGARERFRAKLRDWYDRRTPEPDDSADDWLPDEPEPPQASRYLLPTTGTLSLADKYARVAAIHDAVCERCEELNPWPVTDLEAAPFEDAARGMAFTVLKGWVTPGDLPDTPDVRERAEELWRDVRSDLITPPTVLRLNPAALGNSEKNNEKQRTVAECERFIRGFLPPCEWTPTRLASEGRIGVPVTEVVEELRGRGCAEGDACQAIDAMLARGEIRCFNRDQRYVEWVGTTLPEAATPATGGDGKTATVPDDALLPPRALADAFGIPDKADALRTRLNRWRKTNHAGWVENADRSGTEPQFTYRVGAVRHIVEALKSGS